MGSFEVNQYALPEFGSLCFSRLFEKQPQILRLRQLKLTALRMTLCVLAKFPIPKLWLMRPRRQPPKSAPAGYVLP